MHVQISTSIQLKGVNTKMLQTPKISGESSQPNSNDTYADDWLIRSCWCVSVCFRWVVTLSPLCGNSAAIAPTVRAGDSRPVSVTWPLPLRLPCMFVHECPLFTVFKLSQAHNSLLYRCSCMLFVSWFMCYLLRDIKNIEPKLKSALISSSASIVDTFEQ